MRVLPCRPTTRDLISSMSCSVLSTGSSASMRTTSPRCPPPSLLWGLHSFKRQCTGPLSLHSTLRRHRLSLKAVYEESMAHVILRFSQPLTLREAIGTALPSPVNQCLWIFSHTSSTPSTAGHTTSHSKTGTRSLHPLSAWPSLHLSPRHMENCFKNECL